MVPCGSGLAIRCEKFSRHSVATPLSNYIGKIQAKELKAFVSARRWDVYSTKFKDFSELKKYLFDTTVPPLQYQMHNRECENLIRECILNRIRESIPIEHILQIYLDETQETDVAVEEKKEGDPVTAIVIFFILLLIMYSIKLFFLFTNLFFCQ